MALKPKDIRALNADDRAKALREARQDLMHERGQAAMGGAVKNPGRIRALRTTIARLLTVAHEEQRAGNGRAPRPAAKPARAAPKAAKAPAAAAPAKAPKAKAPARAAGGAKDKPAPKGPAKGKGGAR